MVKARVGGLDEPLEFLSDYNFLWLLVLDVRLTVFDHFHAALWIQALLYWRVAAVVIAQKMRTLVLS